MGQPGTTPGGPALFPFYGRLGKPSGVDRSRLLHNVREMAAERPRRIRCLPRPGPPARGLVLVAGLGLALGAALRAAEPAPPPPWAEWFAKNTVATDKKAYVHFFWNANDVKDRFPTDGRARDAMLAEAARQLVGLQYPKTATADSIRVDVVFVAQRDEYGMPKWDTMRRVAHLEFSRKTLEAARPDESDPRRGFDKFEVYP